MLVAMSMSAECRLPEHEECEDRRDLRRAFSCHDWRQSCALPWLSRRRSSSPSPRGGGSVRSTWRSASWPPLAPKPSAASSNDRRALVRTGRLRRFSMKSRPPCAENQVRGPARRRPERLRGTREAPVRARAVPVTRAACRRVDSSADVTASARISAEQAFCNCTELWTCWRLAASRPLLL